MAGAFLGFCSMKRLRVLLPPLPQMRWVTASSVLPITHFIHLGGERQCRLKFSSKETTRWQGLRLELLTFRSEVQCANYYTTLPLKGWGDRLHHKLRLIHLFIAA